LKRIICVAISLCLVLSCFQVGVFADEERAAGDNSRFTGLVAMSVGLDISDIGRAVVSVDVALREGYTAEMQVNLAQYGAYETVIVKEWNPSFDEGGGVWGGVWYVASGYLYVAEVTLDVYDLNGNFIETVELDSSAKYY